MTQSVMLSAAKQSRNLLRSGWTIIFLSYSKTVLSLDMVSRRQPLVISVDLALPNKLSGARDAFRRLVIGDY